MADAAHEGRGSETPLQHLDDDDGRGTEAGTTQSTNGTDVNYKNPPDRDGDEPSL